MADHSKLSPSSTSRWTSCYASVPMSKGVPSSSSRASVEGTTAHRLCELALINKYLHGPATYDPEMPESLLGEECDETGQTYDHEMVEGAKLYVSAIDAIIAENVGLSKDGVHAEARLCGEKIAKGLFGTADCLLVFKNKTVVIDFKYGRRLVPVENNLQLLTYAAMASCEKKTRRYEVVVVQPRNSNEEGQVSSWAFDQERLDEHIGLLKRSAKKVNKASKQLKSTGVIEDKYFNPADDACFFCKASPKCEAKERLMLKAMQQNFEVVNTSATFKPALATELTPDKLSFVLSNKGAITRWLDSITEHAELMLTKDPASLPGFKIVEGRSSRGWKDSSNTSLLAMQIHDLTRGSLPVEDMVKIKSPSQIERAAKPEFREAIGDLSTKRPGKPTIAPATDKRRAIVSTHDF